MTKQQQSATIGCGLVAFAAVLGLLIIGGAYLVTTRLGGGSPAAPATQAAPAAMPATQPVFVPAPGAQAAVPPATTQPFDASNAQAPQPDLPPAAPTSAQPLPAAADVVQQTAPQTPLPTYTPFATFTPLPTYTPVPSPTPTPSPTPLPVIDWKQSGTLNVLDWTTTIVIERERKKEGVRSIIPGTDRVVLVVTGKLKAGVDLTRVEPQNVQINGTSIRIVVPRPAITAIELLPGESNVYDADRTWVFSEYAGLELEAMEEARVKLAGPNPTNTRMLETAEAVARLQLTNFLRDLGFQKVEVVFAK